MKKLLIAILLGVFFICVSSADAAQDLKNVNNDQQKTSGQDAAMTPGTRAGQAAATHAQEIIQANPSDTEGLANAYERSDKKEDAKKAWETLEAKSNNDAGLYGRHADALIRMGDTNGAIAQLKKAQQLDQNNIFYTLRITEILATNNKQDEAKAILTKLMNETSDNWVKENAKMRLEQIDALKNVPPAPVGVPLPMTQSQPPAPGGAYTPMAQTQPPVSRGGYTQPPASGGAYAPTTQAQQPPAAGGYTQPPGTAGEHTR